MDRILVAMERTKLTIRTGKRISAQDRLFFLTPVVTTSSYVFYYYCSNHFNVSYAAHIQKGLRSQLHY